jgi:hypothetical protein
VTDRLRGPQFEKALTRVHAQTGDKDAALDTIERFLSTTYFGPGDDLTDSLAVFAAPERIWD